MHRDMLKIQDGVAIVEKLNWCKMPFWRLCSCCEVDKMKSEKDTKLLIILQKLLKRLCNHAYIFSFPRFVGCSIDCEQFLEECSRCKEELQTTQEEMKYSLPTQRKIPIGRKRCDRRSNLTRNSKNPFPSDCLYSSIIYIIFRTDTSTDVNSALCGQRVFHFFLSCLQSLFSQTNFL